jgi:geranylgeranyl diphosphate synthase type II
MPSFRLGPYLASRAARVGRALRTALRRSDGCPLVLARSMRYSVFAGGKRLRPILCLAAAETVGLPAVAALHPACALELVHTYSLIHDDLPALDDDDLRRGRKTNHVVFGEDMAILAGDALLTLAFERLADPSGYPPALRRNIPAAVAELAVRAGLSGMVGGQVSDLEAEGQRPTLVRVLSIHRRKTGALLSASVRLPALLKGSPRRVLAALTRYGESAGLAFQIVDDILNETGDARTLGKAAGSDRERGKTTYPAAVGLDAARREVDRLTREAVEALDPLGPRAQPLRELALHMARRSR